MVQRFRLSHLLLTLFLLTSITSAWPWPPSYKDIEGLILRRQDDSKSDTTSTSSSASPSKTSDAASKTTDSDSKSDSKSNSNSATGTAASKTAKASNTAAATSGAAASASGTQEAAATTQSVNPVLPAGGVNMITPSALAQTTYYKIGDYVSFAWNYTSLSITPSKVDVLVSCSANSATYTLQNNASFEKTGSVVWDTSPDITGTAPLLTETYTLVIYDAQEAITEVASAGKLGVSDDFTFGMYIPQMYTPLADWTCAVCSAALSDTERQALKFMFGMCIVTVLSFTWFVSGIF
ncbi:MAG: hypothetical protein ALECFALPRED_003249 [Alectoria fallacina]|uniref:DUF7137 domain-containing protein n=1 Tax=Alectoria fallacina TaxID=1903189 RepID=A0A8H3INS7_9LECA|nr:MAG: hypothetical protein ALECFALPRED_003249 [Alectoria fallacina]